MIAAVAGLITAITQLGGGGSEKSGATTTIVAANGLSAAERELLGDIPASVRDSCGKAVDPEEGNAAAEAGVKQRAHDLTRRFPIYQ